MGHTIPIISDVTSPITAKSIKMIVSKEVALAQTA